MDSILTRSFLKLKLGVSLEEAERLNKRTLDLRCHGLQECPNLSARLSSNYQKTVQCLLLQFNKLSEFHATFCHGLRNLKALSLDYNRLTDLPYEFRKLEYLTMLNVSHNQFSDLHFLYVICQIKTLKVLWANATGLQEIPQEIQNLKKLRILGLRKNHLKSLPKELFSLNELQWLTLSSNEIEEIPDEISNLQQLAHLNLQYNCLTSLPLSLSYLEELQYLLLQYNNITIDEDLTSFIRTFPKLKRCWLAGNLQDLADSNTTPVQQISRHETASANMSPLSEFSGSQLDEIGFQDAPNGDESSNTTTALPVIEVQEQQEVGISEGSVGSVMKADGIEVMFQRNTQNIGERSCQSTGERETDHERDHEITVNTSEYQMGSVMESTCQYNIVEQNKEVDQHLECHLHHPTLDSNEGEKAARAQTEDLASAENVIQCNSDRCAAQSPVKLAFAAQVDVSHENRIDPAYNPHESVLSSSESYDRIRMLRTREWINCHSASQESTKTFDTNCNFSEEKAFQESLHETIELQVNELIADSGKEVGKHNNDVRSAESRLVFIPLSSKGHLPISQARSTCLRPGIVPIDETPRLKAPIGNNNEQEENTGDCETLSLVSAREENDLRESNNMERASIVQDNENIETHATTSATFATICQRFTSTTSIPSRSRLEFESNYDPSDFEHSTPSSAIDDQDFATRFVDVNAEDDRSELMLDEDDMLAVVPRMLMMMPPAYDIPMPIEHHPIGYIWRFCKAIVKYIRWQW